MFRGFLKNVAVRIQLRYKISTYADAPVELGFCQPPNVADSLMFDVTCGEIYAPSVDRQIVPDSPK